MSDGDSQNRAAQPSELRAKALVARAQHLIDTRPQGEYPVAWCIEAAHIGDLTVIATVAARASRPA